MKTGDLITAVPEVVEVRVPIAFRRTGYAKRIIAPDGAAVPVEQIQPDSTMIKALARAFRWRRLLEEGRHATLSDLAATEKINPSYVSRILRLTLLAPDIVEAILNGTQPPSVSMDCLVRPFSTDWQMQRSQLAAKP
jgi:AraC-like DNA-binding protein